MSSGAVPWFRERGMGATILVAAISTAFAVTLVTATRLIGAWLTSLPFFAGGDTVTFVVGMLGALLLLVAMYVAAIVTANTFATIVAGRTRLIALRRLIGASARAERAAIAGQGLAVGAVGAFTGLVGGTFAVWGIARMLVPRMIEGGAAPALAEFSVPHAALLLPAAAVALTTWAAAWAGSRRVLEVTPLEAISGAVERSAAEASASRGRRAATTLLLVAGALLLTAGVAVGLSSPLGVVVAFAGGVLSFTGLAIGAVLIMPTLLRASGRMLGRSAEARLAAANALRHPERTSRMAIGIVMGVTLVTMFAVASESAVAVLYRASGDAPPAEMVQIIGSFTAIMMGLVAVSAIIAAVGLVNLLTIGIVQRRRELGLLRALGLSGAQVRRVVRFEAVHLVATSLVVGLALGTVYGWAGAQAVLGSVEVPPAWSTPTFVAPALPAVPLVVVVVATAALAVVASVVPTRLATRVTPVEALAEIA